MKTLPTALVFIALVTSIPHARSQSINIDIDGQGPGSGLPSSLFAAAGLPGTWNAAAFNSTALALVGIDGSPTAATFTNSGGFAFTFDNPATSGDDQLLLDDAIDPGQSSTCTIANLAAGTYTVITYAWAPDSSFYRTGVSVNGGPITDVGGAFSGSYVVGVTHARDVVAVPQSGSITITFTVTTTFATFNGVQIVRQGDAVSTCQSGTAGLTCPCSASTTSGHGCPNSSDPAGAILSSSGSASISADTMILGAAGMPPSGTCLYFQGTALTSAVTFGDGLTCVGGTMTRLAVRTNSAGASAYPIGAEAPLSVRGGATAGALLGYEVLYRDAPAFCNAATFNMTNGLAVAWGP